MARHRAQKGKGRKRQRAWHRGAGETRRWARTRLPDVASGADPTTGAPTPLSTHRRPRSTP